jgi:glycerol-3-phosphate dehydrogenase
MKPKRSDFIQRIEAEPSWDVLVIGGGSTGLGCALDAASRGLKTLLVERGDFAKGTSSRSTKLVHGGVRYLAQGDIRLVYEALHERGLMLRNAPHLVHRQSFIIPCYNQWSRLQFLLGLKCYDWLAGRHSFGPSSLLSAAGVRRQLPGINPMGLKGGIEYFDGQFDDARFAVNLAQTCAEKGGTPVNYMKVTNLLKAPDGKITGAIVYDLESKRQHIIWAKAVINATGIFVDEILDMDVAGRPPLVRPSQGIHLVLPLSFLGGGSALMIPSTTDGRVLFAVPWYNHLLLGTTDTPLNKHDMEPRALEEEIEFVLKNARRYLRVPPERKDILSIFAGLRPLAAPTGHEPNATKEISRSHKLITHASGLITITGGKWTTYRKMAQDTIDQVMRSAGLPFVGCITQDLPIHGHTSTPEDSHLAAYGSDAGLIRQLTRARPELDEPLIEGFPYLKAEVVWAVQAEMARTVEDVLARRLRLLFLNAGAAIQAAPAVAALMAAELNRDQDWVRRQVLDFDLLAYPYGAHPAPLQTANA